MEVEQRLIPYSVYLPRYLVDEMRAMAKTRNASEFIRNAVASAVAGNNAYTRGFNDGLLAARDSVLANADANALLIGTKRRPLADVLADKIEALYVE